ncbi:DUF4886 domain-containing protein [Burkholderia diffusa]|uniref:DUF4886 domain-containing protein n=1 Tax=Burkholderia diffusa TaxID=488732 RepID=UPI000AF68A39|nr:DUF4886 domain-containing protein [Burkholderia diffusa]
MAGVLIFTACGGGDGGSNQDMGKHTPSNPGLPDIPGEPGDSGTPDIPGKPGDPDLPKKLRIGFVGNSLTEGHDVPGILKALAAKADPSTDIDILINIPGGQTVRGHTSEVVTFDMLLTEGLDYVFIQEQSYGPDFHRTIDHIDPLIAMAQANGTKVILYQTWSTGSTAKNGCVGGSRNRVPEAYNKLADRLPTVGMAPVGDAFEIYTGHASLCEPDGYHQNQNGAYLAALTMYTSIFKQSPVGLAAPDHLNIAQSQQEILQVAAWAAYRGGASCIGQTSGQCKGYQYAQRALPDEFDHGGTNHAYTLDQANRMIVPLSASAYSHFDIKLNCKSEPAYPLAIIQVENRDNVDRTFLASGDDGGLSLVHQKYYSPRQKNIPITSGFQMSAGERGYLILSCGGSFKKRVDFSFNLRGL